MLSDHNQIPMNTYIAYFNTFLEAKHVGHFDSVTEGLPGSSKFYPHASEHGYVISLGVSI